MARLLKAQRQYLMERVEAEVTKAVKAAITRLDKDSIIGNVTSLNTRQGGIRLYFQEPFSSKDVCGSKELHIKNNLSAVLLPHSWYKAEHAKGNFTVDFTFHSCGVGNPRAVTTFKNEEKALKALKAKEKKRFDKEYDNTHAAVDELRFIEMETNKLIKGQMDTIMLGDEPAVAKALADIIEEMAKITA